MCIFGFARLGRHSLELSTSAGPFARLQVLTDAILLHCHTLKGYSRNNASYQAVPYANVVPDGQQRLLSTATDVTLYIYISVVSRMCFSGCGIHPKPEAKKSRRHIPVPVADQH